MSYEHVHGGDVAAVKMAHLDTYHDEGLVFAKETGERVGYPLHDRRV
jgi:hypothetical protein